jgi:hypothetical protein
MPRHEHIIKPAAKEADGGTKPTPNDDDTDRDIKEFERLSGTGDSSGWKFNREEVHER